jgi:hypothetical protein
MATIGNLEAFEQSEDLAEYCERLEQFFVANGITGNHLKRAVLLSVCGKNAYSLIRSVLLPKKPDEVEFGEILEAVSNHLSPKPSVIVARFRFFRRRQLQTEGIT